MILEAKNRKQKIDSILFLQNDFDLYELSILSENELKDILNALVRNFNQFNQ